jgi:hypothetical protein
MKKFVVLGAALAVGAALSAAMYWYFRGEDLRLVKDPGAGDSSMAEMLDKAAEQIVREEGLDREDFCLRVPVWAQQYDDGCVLVRPALVAHRRKCTPYRASNGDCYAVEMRAALFENERMKDLLFARAADICIYSWQVSPTTGRGGRSIDCVSPGDEYQLVRRLEPMLCVFAVDENEEPVTPGIAIRRQREVQDYWCSEADELMRARSEAQPTDCWLGVRRPAPGGGSFGGCWRDDQTGELYH